jgi:hypothetical protein
MHRYIARGLAAEMLMGRRVYYVAPTKTDAENALLEVRAAVAGYKRLGACSFRNSRANSVIEHRSGGYIRFLSYGGCAVGQEGSLRGHKGDTVIVQAVRDELPRRTLALLLAIGPADFLP